MQIDCCSIWIPEASEVPNVIGVEEAAAISLLKERGLDPKLSETTVKPDLPEVFYITYQSISSGTAVAKGTEITIHSSN